MRFRITQHPWPISGDRTVPTGTLIDTEIGIDDFSRLAREKQLPIPPNAQPADQQTYDAMARLYDKCRIMTVPGADGIKR